MDGVIFPKAKRKTRFQKKKKRSRGTHETPYLQMVKVASEVVILEEGSQYQPSGSTFATSLCLRSSWECCQQWLHIPLVEHINIFLILSLVMSNNYIFSTYITLTSSLNIHNSTFIILALHMCITNVHTFNFSYLKIIHFFYIMQLFFIYTIAIKYIDTIILHYLSHTFIYSLTLEYTNITWHQRALSHHALCIIITTT